MDSRKRPSGLFSGLKNTARKSVPGAFNLQYLNKLPQTILLPESFDVSPNSKQPVAIPDRVDVGMGKQSTAGKTEEKDVHRRHLSEKLKAKKSSVLVHHSTCSRQSLQKRVLDVKSSLKPGVAEKNVKNKENEQLVNQHNSFSVTKKEQCSTENTSENDTLLVENPVCERSQMNPVVKLSKLDSKVNSGKSKDVTSRMKENNVLRRKKLLKMISDRKDKIERKSQKRHTEESTSGSDSVLNAEHKRSKQDSQTTKQDSEKSSKRRKEQSESQSRSDNSKTKQTVTELHSAKKSSANTVETVKPLPTDSSKTTHPKYGRSVSYTAESTHSRCINKRKQDRSESTCSENEPCLIKKKKGTNELLEKEQIFSHSANRDQEKDLTESLRTTCRSDVSEKKANSDSESHNRKCHTSGGSEINKRKEMTEKGGSGRRERSLSESIHYVKQMKQSHKNNVDLSHSDVSKTNSHKRKLQVAEMPSAITGKKEGNKSQHSKGHSLGLSDSDKKEKKTSHEHKRAKTSSAESSVKQKSYTVAAHDKDHNSSDGAVLDDNVKLSENKNGTSRLTDLANSSKKTQEMVDSSDSKICPLKQKLETSDAQLEKRHSSSVANLETEKRVKSKSHHTHSSKDKSSKEEKRKDSQQTETQNKSQSGESMKVVKQKKSKSQEKLGHSSGSSSASKVAEVNGDSLSRAIEKEVGVSHQIRISPSDSMKESKQKTNSSACSVSKDTDSRRTDSSGDKKKTKNLDSQIQHNYDSASAKEHSGKQNVVDTSGKLLEKEATELHKSVRRKEEVNESQDKAKANSAQGRNLDEQRKSSESQDRKRHYSDSTDQAKKKKKLGSLGKEYRSSETSVSAKNRSELCQSNQKTSQSLESFSDCAKEKVESHRKNSSVLNSANTVKTSEESKEPLKSKINTRTSGTTPALKDIVEERSGNGSTIKCKGVCGQHVNEACSDTLQNERKLPKAQSQRSDTDKTPVIHEGSPDEVRTRNDLNNQNNASGGSKLALNHKNERVIAKSHKTFNNNLAKSTSFESSNTIEENQEEADDGQSSPVQPSIPEQGNFMKSPSKSLPKQRIAHTNVSNNSENHLGKHRLDRSISVDSHQSSYRKQSPRKRSKSGESSKVNMSLREKLKQKYPSLFAIHNQIAQRNNNTSRNIPGVLDDSLDSSSSDSPEDRLYIVTEDESDKSFSQKDQENDEQVSHQTKSDESDGAESETLFNSKICDTDLGKTLPVKSSSAHDPSNNSESSTKSAADVRRPLFKGASSQQSAQKECGVAVPEEPFSLFDKLLFVGFPDEYARQQEKRKSLPREESENAVKQPGNSSILEPNSKTANIVMRENGPEVSKPNNKLAEIGDKSKLIDPTSGTTEHVTTENRLTIVNTDNNRTKDSSQRAENTHCVESNKLYDSIVSCHPKPSADRVAVLGEEFKGNGEKDLHSDCDLNYLCSLCGTLVSGSCNCPCSEGEDSQPCASQQSSYGMCETKLNVSQKDSCSTSTGSESCSQKSCSNTPIESLGSKESAGSAQSESCDSAKSVSSHVISEDTCASAAEKSNVGQTDQSANGHPQSVVNSMSQQGGVDTFGTDSESFLDGNQETELMKAVKIEPGTSLEMHTGSSRSENVNSFRENGENQPTSTISGNMTAQISSGVSVSTTITGSCERECFQSPTHRFDVVDRSSVAHDLSTKETPDSHKIKQQVRNYQVPCFRAWHKPQAKEPSLKTNISDSGKTRSICPSADLDSDGTLTTDVRTVSVGHNGQDSLNSVESARPWPQCGIALRSEHRPDQALSSEDRLERWWNEQNRSNCALMQNSNSVTEDSETLRNQQGNRFVRIPISHHKITNIGTQVISMGEVFPQLFYLRGNCCVRCRCCSQWMAPYQFMVHHDMLPPGVHIDTSKSLAEFQIKAIGELTEVQQVFWDQFCRDLRNAKECWRTNRDPLPPFQTTAQNPSWPPVHGHSTVQNPIHPFAGAVTLPNQPPRANDSITHQNEGPRLNPAHISQHVPTMQHQGIVPYPAPFHNHIPMNRPLPPIQASNPSQTNSTPLAFNHGHLSQLSKVQNQEHPLTAHSHVGYYHFGPSVQQSIPNGNIPAATGHMSSSPAGSPVRSQTHIPPVHIPTPTALPHTNAPHKNPSLFRQTGSGLNCQGWGNDGVMFHTSVSKSLTEQKKTTKQRRKKKGDTSTSPVLVDPPVREDFVTSIINLASLAKDDTSSAEDGHSLLGQEKRIFQVTSPALAENTTATTAQNWPIDQRHPSIQSSAEGNSTPRENSPSSVKIKSNISSSEQQISPGKKTSSAEEDFDSAEERNASSTSESTLCVTCVDRCSSPPINQLSSVVSDISVSGSINSSTVPNISSNENSGPATSLRASPENQVLYMDDDFTPLQVECTEVTTFCEELGSSLVDQETTRDALTAELTGSTTSTKASAINTSSETSGFNASSETSGISASPETGGIISSSETGSINASLAPVGFNATSKTGGMSASSDAGGISASSETGGINAPSETGGINASSETGCVNDSSETCGINASSETGGINASSEAIDINASSETCGINASSGTGHISASSETGGMNASSETGGINASSETSGMNASSETFDINTSSETCGINASSETGGMNASSETGGINASSGTGGVNASSKASGINASSETVDINTSSETRGINFSSKTRGMNASTETRDINASSETGAINASSEIFGISASSKTFGFNASSKSSGQRPLLERSCSNTNSSTVKDSDENTTRSQVPGQRSISFDSSCLGNLTGEKTVLTAMDSPDGITSGSMMDQPTDEVLQLVDEVDAVQPCSSNISVMDTAACDVSDGHLDDLSTWQLLNLSQKCHQHILKRLAMERNTRTEEIKKLRLELTNEIQEKTVLKSTVSSLLEEVEQLKSSIAKINKMNSC